MLAVYTQYTNWKPKESQIILEICLNFQTLSDVFEKDAYWDAIAMMVVTKIILGPIRQGPPFNQVWILPSCSQLCWTSRRRINLEFVFWYTRKILSTSPSSTDLMFCICNTWKIGSAHKVKCTGFRTDSVTRYQIRRTNPCTVRYQVRTARSNSASWQKQHKN